MNHFNRIVRNRLYERNDENCWEVDEELVDRNEEMIRMLKEFVDQTEEMSQMLKGFADRNEEMIRMLKEFVDQNGEMSQMLKEFVDQILRTNSNDEHYRFLHHFHYWKDLRSQHMIRVEE